MKLKQVHWVKVNDRKIKDTVWEKMKDDEVDIDKDEIEILFAMKESGKPGVKDPSGAGEGGDDLVGPNGQRKKRVVILLSANRSQTIGVLLSHLKVSAPIPTFSYNLFYFLLIILLISYYLSLVSPGPIQGAARGVQASNHDPRHAHAAAQFRHSIDAPVAHRPRGCCIASVYLSERERERERDRERQRQRQTEREREREREGGTHTHTHTHTHRSLPCNHIPGPRRSWARPKDSCLNYCVFHGSRAGCNASSLSSSSTLASTTCRKMSRLSVTHCTTSSGNKFSKFLNIVTLTQ